MLHRCVLLMYRLAHNFRQYSTKLSARPVSFSDHPAEHTASGAEKKDRHHVPRDIFHAFVYRQGHNYQNAENTARP